MVDVVTMPWDLQDRQQQVASLVAAEADRAVVVPPRPVLPPPVLSHTIPDLDDRMYALQLQQWTRRVVRVQQAAYDINLVQALAAHPWLLNSIYRRAQEAGTWPS